MMPVGAQEVLDLQAALQAARADIAGWTHHSSLQMADRAAHLAFITVAQVLNLEGLRLEGELKDVSTHLSGGWAEKISVVKRGGRVVFLVHFDDAEASLGMNGLAGAALEQSRELFRLVFAGGAGFQFWAYVSIGFEVPVRGALMGRVTLDITGQVTAL